MFLVVGPAGCGGNVTGERWGRFPLPSPPAVSRVRMEARGIEPRSENDSDTATTCVGEAFCVSLPRRLARHGSDEPLAALTRPVRAPGHASPILRYVSAASGGLPLTQVREAEAYAASARFELAVVKFASGLTR